ncbi:uncharacterized protein isoform X3 [Leptinotarsa decemlineata]|uniref:uncharacterized protein isoform X3 n=1 Tax=Leptinotarsa decemlineata TaxID=7539 RepID=UPI003D306478
MSKHRKRKIKEFQSRIRRKIRKLELMLDKLSSRLETKIRNNVHFLSDDELVYPVGSVIAVHNFGVRKQRFIKLSDKGKHLTHLAVSPNNFRKFPHNAC